ncbi:hypothetical protein QT381_02915 [Galbitalea sp. SE-J8]|uniref:hypothetical protein n=1 Tax=Galbitalea sp. SE-J8 TaxID=3054952 RepID=UPI00259C72AD|nr:hypothetical protein [Galbitalea sp. SE-J8]MDM4761955.1 hypothetical protein [Galbitalea sp. SE-J8]
MTATASTPASLGMRAELPPPGRLGTLLAVFAFPLWIICFVLLYGSMGAKPDEPQTLAEIHAHALAAGAPVWIFGVLSVIAAVVLAIGPAILGVALARGTGRRVLPGIIIAAGVITALLQLWNTVSYLVFLAAGPSDLPRWAAVVQDGTVGNDVLNLVAWSLSALAAPLLGFTLWRARVAPRTGLVVAIVGGILLLAILFLQFGQPMTPSVLLFALGVALLRPQK